MLMDLFRKELFMICEKYNKCENCAHFYAEDYEEYCNGYGDGSPFCGGFSCTAAPESCSRSGCMSDEAMLEVILGI